MHRIISGLQEAKPCARPSFATGRRATGTRAQGLAYERAVAKALPGAIQGPWFWFRDSGGEGWCSPDLLYVGERAVVVIECKLGDAPLGQSQVAQLYRPVMQQVYAKPVYGLVITKSLARVRDLTGIYTNLLGALRHAHKIPVPIVHWLGHSRL